MVLGLSAQLGALKETLYQKVCELEKKEIQLRKVKNLLLFCFLKGNVDLKSKDLNNRKVEKESKVLMTTEIDKHKVSVIGVNLLECCGIANQCGCQLTISNEHNEVIVDLRDVYGCGLEFAIKRMNALVERHEKSVQDLVKSDYKAVNAKSSSSSSSSLLSKNCCQKTTTNIKTTKATKPTKPTAVPAKTTKETTATPIPTTATTATTTTTTKGQKQNSVPISQITTPTKISKAIPPPITNPYTGPPITADDNFIKYIDSKLGTAGQYANLLKPFISDLLDNNKQHIKTPPELEKAFENTWTNNRLTKCKNHLKQNGGTIHTLMIRIHKQVVNVTVAVVNKTIISKEISTDKEFSKETVQNFIKMDPSSSKSFKIDPDPITGSCLSEKKKGLVSIHRRLLQHMLNIMPCLRKTMHLSSIPVTLAVFDYHVEMNLKFYHAFP